jgi:trimeric autotransporter adhesin
MAILGTPAAELLTGTANADDIQGLAGNDTLNALAGDDTLDGGVGNDSMTGADGADLYKIDATTDIVSETNTSTDPAEKDAVESPVTYTLTSNVEDLTLTGSTAINGTGNASANTITGNTANNNLTGLAGDDILDGSAGTDTMTGGDGADLYRIDVVADSVSETNVATTAAEKDAVESPITYTLPTNVEDLTLVGTDVISGTGNASANKITGNTAINTLSGGAGKDTLNGGIGDDILIGYLDDDTYVVDASGDTITEASGEGNDTVQSSITFALSDTAGANAVNVENIELTGSTAISGTGNASANKITGNTAINALTGGAGDDTLDGGAGVDALDGGAGNDTYKVDNLNDAVTETSSSDTNDSVESSVEYTLGTNLENLTLTGSSAINGTGNGANNKITGNTAANILNGSTGADSLVGGTGNDTYVVDNSGDKVKEDGTANTEIDAVQSSITYDLSLVDTLAGAENSKIENLTLTGNDTIGGTGNALNNKITGNNSANSLTGGAGKDTLDGSLGIDSMTGGADDDTYVVNVSGDTVTEASGGGTADTVNSSANSYTLSADVENLVLTGDANSNGTGNISANKITGTSGDNILNGGGAGGIDTLTGGTGNDTYIVSNDGDLVQETSSIAAEIDTVKSSAANFSLDNANHTNYLENLELTATTGTNNGTGNGLDNNIKSTATTVVNNLPVAAVVNNIIDGGGGADTMAGGKGDDTYSVDNINDVVTEAAGTDTGTDSVKSLITYSLNGTNLENLELLDKDANTTVPLNGTGNSVANTIKGNRGNNIIDGGIDTGETDVAPIVDLLSGGKGSDTYIVDVGDKVNENGTAPTTDSSGKIVNTEIDTVQSSVTFTLTNPTTTDSNIAVENVENLTLTGSALADATGNALDNTIVGNSAVNAIDGKTGKDNMSGGDGNDTYTVDNAGDVVIEAANKGTDTVKAALPIVPVVPAAPNATPPKPAVPAHADTYTLTTNVENLELTGSIAVNGTGNTLDNKMTGNSAANTLDGGTGKDTMAGGAGDDIYIVDNAGDSVSETSAGADTLGIDKVKVALPLIPATTTPTVSPAKADTYLLPDHVENAELTGTIAINITGNGDANNILGNSAANTIDGSGGKDTMAGGAGDDIYSVNQSDDVIDETAIKKNSTGQTVVDNNGNPVIIDAGGIDKVKSSATYILSSNVENLQLIGNTDIDGTGNALANKIDGNGNNNKIDGSTGADTMSGGAGNDTYVVDNAGDVVSETVTVGTTVTDAGGTDTVEASLPPAIPAKPTATPPVPETPATYTLTANVENLTLKGTNAINGTGNTLANSITGNGAANTIDGKAGADVMTGGAGDDIYVVDNALDNVVEDNTAGSGTDTVKASLPLTGTPATTPATYTLTANVEKLELTGTNAMNATGNTLANKITGNGAANILSGIDGNDTLDGGAGNDKLDGGVGADVMTGGAGDDTYIVDDAGDKVKESASAGTDTVESAITFTLTNPVVVAPATPDPDLDVSNVEKLILTGSTAINGTGNALANTITGNGAANIIDGKAGADDMIGGAGNDTYFVDNALDKVTEATGGGADLVKSSVTYTLSADVDDLVLLPGTTAINGTGNTLANKITGNDAANIIDGSGSNDAMTGGKGNDTYIVDAAGDTVAELANEGTDTVKSSVNYFLNVASKGDNVENLVLTDIVTGTSPNTTTTPTNINGIGNDLNNKIDGSKGDNIIDGGTGNDTMTGGDGADTYRVDSILDTVTETNASNDAAQKDKVESTITYTLGANVEDLTLKGTDAINGNGNTLANTIIGNNDDNIIDGKTGADNMKGSTGNDTYIVDNALDLVTETSTSLTEIDTVKASLPLTGTPATPATYTLTDNVENLVLTGSNAMNGTGNGLENQITGNTGANILDGKAGADTLIGGTGADTYVVDNLNDIITESSTASTEIDTVQNSFNVTTEGGYILGTNLENLELGGTAAKGSGNSLNNKMTGNGAANNLDGISGNDTLLGNAGNDILTGGAGTDSLVGGDDLDTLIGDGGNDTLTGGAGADTFKYNTDFAFSTGNFGMDVFTDFTTGDKIELGTNTFTALTSGISFGLADSDTAAAIKDELIVYNSTNGHLFYNQNGKTAGFGTGAQFATLTGNPTLGAGDFTLV